VSTVNTTVVLLIRIEYFNVMVPLHYMSSDTGVRNY